MIKIVAKNNESLDGKYLTFIEEWKDEKAIEIHNNSEHFKSIVPKLSKFKEGDINHGNMPALAYVKVYGFNSDDYTFEEKRLRNMRNASGSYSPKPFKLAFKFDINSSSSIAMFSGSPFCISSKNIEGAHSTFFPILVLLKQ